MPAPDSPPPLDEYKGRTLRSWLEAFYAWTVRDRIILDGASGIEQKKTLGGRLLRITQQAFGVFVVKASGTITARSSTTPGTGSAVVQSYSGSTLADTGETITVKNLIPSTVSSGKYGLAFRVGGYYFGIFEC